MLLVSLKSTTTTKITTITPRERAATVHDLTAPTLNNPHKSTGSKFLKGNGTIKFIQSTEINRQYMEIHNPIHTANLPRE